MFIYGTNKLNRKYFIQRKLTQINCLVITLFEKSLAIIREKTFFWGFISMCEELKVRKF
jgi:hypothetical protein